MLHDGLLRTSDGELHRPPLSFPETLRPMSAPVVTRFAPSPTGQFHVGNLRTAWISWQWSRALATPWIVRFEDIDAPRVKPGALEAQLEDLARLGMKPGSQFLQSERAQRHRALP